MAFSIDHETKISIENIPVQWVSLVELYNPELPQFPMQYVHVLSNQRRIFGFPVSYNFQRQRGHLATLELTFLSNIDLTTADKALIKTELKHRFGAQNPVVREDIEQSVAEERKRRFLLQLWDSFITPTYGGKLPFGAFFEGMYSLVRCSAAFIPMSGGKSEEQMLYDFIRHYGEKVNICEPWNFLEFFLLPTYDELLTRNFDDFPNYRILQSAIDKFADRYFNSQFTSGMRNFRTIRPTITNMDGYNIQSANGMRDLDTFLLNEEIITIEEKGELDFLIDAFNRLATRALGFMGLTINAIPANDLGQWTGDDFKQFYIDVENGRSVGLYPKIWSMVLQQGFGNPEAIPIDNWIETFYSIPLQVCSKEEFLQNFRRMGKFERMLWVTSQARKTNMHTIIDWVWCLKYGTGKTTDEITDLKGSRGNRLRDANPLSCLKCPLKADCLGYLGIQDEPVYVMSRTEVLPESEVRTRHRASFIILTIDNVPKYVFSGADQHYKLIDGFTGLEIHDMETSFTNETVTVAEFMADLLA